MFHPYLLRVMAQEKDTCALVLVGCFWLFNLENRFQNKAEIPIKKRGYLGSRYIWIYIYISKVKVQLEKSSTTF